jgi:hypothetical protein
VQSGIGEVVKLLWKNLGMIYVEEILKGHVLFSGDEVSGVSRDPSGPEPDLY